MMYIDINNLNSFELSIHNKIKDIALNESNLTIVNIANKCACSTSKISKMVRKLGLSSYKEYISFVQGKEIEVKKTSNEIERIIKFLKEFDPTIIDSFIEQFQLYEKIILFGYGPSYICAQYFEYKLRVITSKVIIASDDELSIQQVIDQDTLVIAFSTTGKFKSFNKLKQLTEKQGGKLLMLLEENNNNIINDYDNVFLLTKTSQENNLLPYEKSRTVFFIFIEEVVQKLMKLKN